MARFSSKVNPVLELSLNSGLVVLDAAHANYSFGGLHRLFRKVFQRVKTRSFENTNVLILGFGAGSVAQILRKEHGINCRITGVEIDPVVIDIARKYFQVGEMDDLEILNQDAAVFIRETEKKYKLIVVDVYLDRDVPDACQQEKFIGMLQKRLQAGGLVVYNKMICNDKTAGEAEGLEKHFRQCFTEVKVFKFREISVNRIFLASNDPLNTYL